MWSKISAILGSIRFWQIVIGAVVIVLGSYNIISSEVANVIAGALGLSVTIGTIDKVAGK